ncbi:MAG: tyrosine--tRNA ligase [Solirubrobacteraceae bacterium]|nr:tyrosine--tRNA ligase [Solirubrobacteraceae bacterium]
MLPETILDELDARGLVHTCTNRDTLAERLHGPPMTVYCGFDPTADSLHVGHLLSLQVLRLWKRRGHRAVALVGGFTGMVGDPSGKSEERNLLDVETLDRNREALTAQIGALLKDGAEQPLIVDNRSWFEEMSALAFLRDVGKLVPVSEMLARESVKSRLGGDGLSFTEFSYQLLQAHDFAHLRAEMDCEVQLGGSDQYGNITAGTDMIRRRQLGPAWGLVWPLLTKADGTKFGKTDSGAVWLDPERTSPFAFHQFWFNSADADVGDLLRKFTLLTGPEIDDLLARHEVRPSERLAQRALADKVTAWVHGQDAVDAAARLADALFAGNLDTAGVRQIAGAIPTGKFTAADLAELRTDQVAHRTGLFKSVGEARRTASEGGLYVGGAQATDPGAPIDAPEGWVVLRRGKRAHALVIVTETDA